jgi:TPR repeat protein
MYANGGGVARNRAKAIEWFREAARQGDINANVALERLGAL